MEGNRFGNINHGGIAAENDEYIYFSLQTEAIDIYVKSDETIRPLLEEPNATSLNFYDGWLYYLNSENVICRMNAVGSKSEKILENIGISRFYIADGYLYYSQAEEGGACSLYRMAYEDLGKEAASSQLLVSKMTDSCLVEKGWIYYWNKADSHLYKVKTDGTEKKEISDLSGQGAVISGDWIYFANSQGIHRLKKDAIFF